MYGQWDRIHGIRILACIKCGKRIYEDYPQRHGGSKEDRLWLEKVFSKAYNESGHYFKRWQNREGEHSDMDILVSGG
jgi:hypothetical protein